VIKNFSFGSLQITLGVLNTTITKGENVTVSGSINSHLKGINVTFAYRRPDGSLVQRTAPTNSCGISIDTYKPDTVGTWNVSASFTMKGVKIESQVIPFLVQKPSAITANVDIDPDTLNLKSKGKWITCYITLPEGYNVSEIKTGTILLNDTIPAEWTDVQDNVLMVKFNRTKVIDLMTLGNQTIKITGELTDETPFEGIDTIRTIHNQITLVNLRTIHLYVDGAFLQGENLKIKFYSYSGTYQGETTVWSGTTPAQIDLSLDLSQNSTIEKAALILIDKEGNSILSLVNFVVHQSDLSTRMTQIGTEWAYASPSERTAIFQEIIETDMQWPYAPP